MSIHKEALVQHGLPLLPSNGGEQAALFHVITDDQAYADYIRNGGKPSDEMIPGTEYIDVKEYVKRLVTL